MLGTFNWHSAVKISYLRVHGQHIVVLIVTRSADRRNATATANMTADGPSPVEYLKGGFGDSTLPPPEIFSIFVESPRISSTNESSRPRSLTTRRVVCLA